PRVFQAVHLDAFGCDLWHRRRALRAPGRDHQSERDVAGQFDRNRHLDRRRRPRHLDRAGARRGGGQSGQELVHQGISGILAVRAGSAIHPGDAVSAARSRRLTLAQESGMSEAETREHWDDPVASGARVLTEGVDTTYRGILYLDGISVSFDGFKALNNLSLLIDAGELRCVIGPNGAGKTTMMDVITGKTRPDLGSAFFGQTIDLTRLTEPEIAGIGIGRKFQKPTVFEQHSVFENLELAMKADKRVGPTLRARLDAAARERIVATLETIKLLPEAARPAGLLSHGQKQWLEIGMLLMQEPQLLLLDE